MKQTKNEKPSYKGPKKGLTAILLGATGLTGGILLQQLLKDPRYEKIVLFSRKTSKIKDPKIDENTIDLFELGKHQAQFIADEVYCCIGTTQKKTPDKKTYRKIDYGIPVTAAQLAQKNGISTFLVISSLGADPKSWFFYNKTKGEMERAVLNQNIPNTYIFQPSLINGKREESRFFETAWKKVMTVADHLLVGPLKKYKSISPEIIAQAMISVANNGAPHNRIGSDEIKEIAKRSSKKHSDPL